VIGDLYHIKAGDRVELRIGLRVSAPDAWLQWVEDRLRDAGVQLIGHIEQVPGGSSTVIIRFVEGESAQPDVVTLPAPAMYRARMRPFVIPVIPASTAAVIVALAILAALIIGFAMLVYVAEKFGWVGVAAVGVLALGGLYVLSTIFKRER
jgi:hypothetical protein